MPRGRCDLYSESGIGCQQVLIPVESTRLPGPVHQSFISGLQMLTVFPKPKAHISSRFILRFDPFRIIRHERTNQAAAQWHSGFVDPASCYRR